MLQMNYHVICPEEEIRNYKLNSLTHVLELYKFYNELVELIIPLVPWYGMPAATSVGSRFLPLRARFFQQTTFFVCYSLSLMCQIFFIAYFPTKT